MNQVSDYIWIFLMFLGILVRKKIPYGAKNYFT